MNKLYKLESGSLQPVASRSGITVQIDRYEAQLLDLGQAELATRLDDLPFWNELVARRKTFAMVGHREDERNRLWLLINDQARENDADVRQAILAASSNGWVNVGTIACADELMELVKQNPAGVDSNGAKSPRMFKESDYQKDFAELGKEAVNRGASDIHIKLKRGVGRIEFRIHGSLVKVRDCSSDYVTELVRTIYNVEVERGSTKDSFNPSARQDGVINHRYQGVGGVRFRYSGIPLAPNGFGVALRVIPLDAKSQRWDPIEAGYSADQTAAIMRAARRPSGMLIFVGVTGSGKSTSMAGILRKIGRDQPDKLIRTVEDPVEQIIDEADQTAVIGDFVDTLRQILRSDPDRLMVGEIRDLETASVTIQAVRTGHATMTTLHVDSAPNAYDRLVGIGVPRADLGSVGLVNAIVYQRLVPALCTYCKVPYKDFIRENAQIRVLEQLNAVYTHTELALVHFAREGGCDKCNHSGVKGRTLCAEVLVPDADVLRAVANNDSVGLWESWRSKIQVGEPANMTGRTANEHARWKMLQGIVSPVDVDAEFGPVDEPVFKKVKETER
jgi:general secretion pathway protein E